MAAGDVETDVAVVGGGLAGLATAAHLARDRKRVVCVEPRPWPRPAVGESLEFSAPRLLADLGVDLDGDGPPLFPKTSVEIAGGDEDFTVWPPRWFGRAPIWCSRLAFHVDRTRLDHRLMRLAIDDGVEILPERVTSIDHDGEVIAAITTDGDRHIRADWFIDATGHSCRLFGRALGLDREVLGEPRVAFWTRVDEPPADHATHLYFPEPSAEDLSWAWEIPLTPDELSIGAVLSTARLSRLRAAGHRPREVFERQLAAIPRLRAVMGEHPEAHLSSTSYTPYRYRRPMGPNWLLVGDASAMVDPLTSNGVTSALRHAERAARTVSCALEDDRGNRRATWAYRNTAPATVATLDQAMEAFLYQPAARQRLGLRGAVALYAGTGVITNSWYAKINPTTVRSSVACAAMLGASRTWTRLAGLALRGLARRRRGAGAGRRRTSEPPGGLVAPTRSAPPGRSSRLETSTRSRGRADGART